MTYSFNLMT